MIQPLLIFTHIPKCGGSSIRESVRSKLGDRLLAAYSKEEKEVVRRSPLEALRGKSALFGHFEFPVLNRFLDAASYFTVIRDPVDRFISDLSYHRWNQNAAQHTLIKPLSDRAALTVLLSGPRGSNVLTNYFGRPGNVTAAFQVACQHYKHIGHVENIRETFSWLAKNGYSDGEEMKVNDAKDGYQVSLADRAFIRSHLYEDLKLHDLLIANFCNRNGG